MKLAIGTQTVKAGESKELKIKCCFLPSLLALYTQEQFICECLTGFYVDIVRFYR